MILPFGLLLIWLLDKFKISNHIIRTMNPYAPFLYLFQFVVLEILKNYYVTSAHPFDIFYFWGVLLLTSVLAIALQHRNHSWGTAYFTFFEDGLRMEALIFRSVPKTAVNCYKCVRNCPVKAIRVHDHQARIIESQCIYCEKCNIAIHAKEILRLKKLMR